MRLFFLICAIVVSANILGPYRLHGKIKSFDDKKIVLQNEEYRYEIPRSFVEQKTFKIDALFELALDDKQFQQVRMKSLKDLSSRNKTK
jgi:hypothetical protein